MIRFNNKSLVKLVYILIDVACICFSFYLTCWMNEAKLPFDVTLRSLFFAEDNPFRFIFLSWVVVSLFLLNAHGLYQTRREVLEGIELTLVVRSVILTAFMMVVAIYITKAEGFPRSIFIISTFVIMCTLSIWRVIKRFFVEYLVSSGYNNLNVLIIGAGKVGQELLREIKGRPGLGLKVVGFLDDYKENDPDKSDVNILGKISQFTSIARSEFINKIFITIHHDSKVFLDLLEKARELGIAVRVIPQGFELTSGEFYKYNIGLVPVLEYCGIEYSRSQFGKRVFDFIASFLATILLLPVFFILGVLIKIDSRGPVFYVSKRYGRKGQMFNMLKFRTMVRDADKQFDGIRDRNEVDGPIFKIKEDPRITKFGKFLRRYSIDELPQIINVLLGEMSLVGPRPFPIDQIEKEDLKQLKRLEVKPGITGLWQIRGRSDIPFSRLVRWDIWYINNWSFWLDINILLETIPVVLKGRGAY